MGSRGLHGGGSAASALVRHVSQRKRERERGRILRSELWALYQTLMHIVLPAPAPTENASLQGFEPWA